MNEYVRVCKIQNLVMAKYGMWWRSSGMTSSEGLGMGAKLQSYCWLPYSFKRCTYILFVFFYFTLTTQKGKVSFAMKNKSWVRLGCFSVLSRVGKWGKSTTLNPSHSIRLYGLLNVVVRDLDCEESHCPVRTISLFLLQNCRNVKL
jgi:hypothetical protein